MTPRTLLSSAVLVCALAALAAPTTGIDPRVATGFDTIQVRDLRADLTFLASDVLEGRMSLAPGSEVAIQFIAAEFAKAGLTPAAGDSYLQPVPLIEHLSDVQQTQLTLRQGGKQHRYEFLKHFVGF